LTQKCQDYEKRLEEPIRRLEVLAERLQKRSTELRCTVDTSMTSGDILKEIV